MIRLLGAITGSALAIATLLVLIGVPQFKTATSPTEVVEREVMTLPLPTAPVEPDVHVAATAPEAEPVVEPAEAAAEPAMPGESEVAMADNDEPFPIEDVLPPPVDDVFALPPAAEPQWYAFWSPFRSEIAASGFVARLQSVTGLDYRVVKVKPGEYEVAFAYVDDTDITANLSQISTATGLDLPGN